MGLLTRGRVKHTNSWNYSENSQGGFKKNKKPLFAKGQWVWLPPRSATLKVWKCKVELGVLRLINGSIADGYYAVDGIRFQTHISQVLPCPEKDQNWMDVHKEFAHFRAAATVGIGTIRLKLGRDYILECLGLRKVGHAVLSKATPGLPQPRKLVKATSGVKTNQKIRPEDIAAEKKAKIEASKLLQDKLKIPQPQANKMVNQSENYTDQTPQDPESEGQSDYKMILIGCVVVGAVVLMYI